jgi:hypothetical protein
LIHLKKKQKLNLQSSSIDPYLPTLEDTYFDVLPKKNIILKKFIKNSQKEKQFYSQSSIYGGGSNNTCSFSFKFPYGLDLQLGSSESCIDGHNNYDNNHDCSPPIDDVCYFAFNFPFTYSNVQEHLDFICKDKNKKKYVKRKLDFSLLIIIYYSLLYSILCKSIAGNNIDLLTISSFDCSIKEYFSKLGIVITARVHPGEVFFVFFS